MHYAITYHLAGGKTYVDYLAAEDWLVLRERLDDAEWLHHTWFSIPVRSIISIEVQVRHGLLQQVQET